MTIIDVARELEDHPTKVFAMRHIAHLKLTVDAEGALVDINMKPFPLETSDLLATDWEEVKE